MAGDALTLLAEVFAAQDFQSDAQILFLNVYIHDAFQERNITNYQPFFNAAQSLENNSDICEDKYSVALILCTKHVV